MLVNYLARKETQTWNLCWAHQRKKERRPSTLDSSEEQQLWIRELQIQLLHLICKWHPELFVITKVNSTALCTIFILMDDWGDRTFRESYYIETGLSVHWVYTANQPPICFDPIFILLTFPTLPRFHLQSAHRGSKSTATHISGKERKWSMRRKPIQLQKECVNRPRQYRRSGWNLGPLALCGNGTISCALVANSPISPNPQLILWSLFPYSYSPQMLNQFGRGGMPSSPMSSHHQASHISQVQDKLLGLLQAWSLYVIYQQCSNMVL